MAGVMVSSAVAESNSALAVNGSPSPVPSGAMIAVVGAMFDSGGYCTFSDNQSGNTYTSRVTAIAAPDYRVQIGEAPNVNSSGTFTVTCTSGTVDSKEFSVSAWTGMAAAPFDVANSATGSSTSPSVASGALAQADSVVFAVCTNRDSASVAQSGPTGGGTWNVIYEKEDAAGVTVDMIAASLIVSATTSVTPTFTLSPGDSWVVAVAAYKASSTATVEQEGFRWRDDDGSESAASWLASQDANITRPADTNTRLRMLLNATQDPASAQYQLEYKLSGGATFFKVPTSNTPASPAFGSQGAVATGGTTSVSVAYPATITAGDLLVLFMAVRNGAATITTPTGFTAPSNNTATGGAGAEGADAGTSKCAAYFREADGTESGSLSVTVGNSPSTATGIMLRYTKDAWASWSIAAAQGTDTASGDTSWSAAMNVDPGIAIGDVLLSCIVPNTDASTWSAQDVTGTGLASALVSERTETGVTTPGNDLDIIVCEHDVTAALTSGVPTVVATSSGTTPEGSTVLLRIRTTGTPAMVMSASANVTASGEATTAQLTAPSGKSTSDFDGGRLQDDENPADAVDITADDYTELEWCVKANGAAVSAAQVYQFRVTAAGTELSTYTVTPEWTIPGGGGRTTKNTRAWPLGIEVGMGWGMSA